MSLTLHTGDATSPATVRLGELLRGQESMLLRPLRGLIARELSRQRGRSVPAEEAAGWDLETVVDEHSLGVDSLARLELVSAVNRAFQLHRTGVEDYLLIHRTLRDWCDIVVEGLRQLPKEEPERIGFETSGSTGTPKLVVHDLAELIEEALNIQRLFGRPARVLALVPAHHVYGFLFTVVAPVLHGLPVLDLAYRGPGALAREGGEGDLVVGTPFVWNLIVRTGAQLAHEMTGVTSTAPAPSGMWSELRDLGLTRLIEIYGATETLGIGWRDAPMSEFRFLPHLDPIAEIGDVIAVTRATRRTIVPTDHVELLEDCRFRLLGRRDGAVQVGGTNVFPDRVRAVLESAAGVAETAVRLEGAGAGARLKAFVVPSHGGEQFDRNAMERELRAHSARHLTDPERPVSYSFGSTLPRNAIGKLADWVPE